MSDTASSSSDWLLVPRTPDQGLDVNALYQLYFAARKEKRELRRIWLRNYRLLNNRVGAVPSASWQPTPRSSEIYPICSNFIAWATDNDIVCDLTPTADPDSDWFAFTSNIANDLGNALYHSWSVNNFVAQQKLALWDAVTYGTGIFKAVWDNNASGGIGDALLKRVDVYHFYPDPHATSLSDANYIVEARMMSYADIERRWPDKALELEAIGPGEDLNLDERPRNPETETSRNEVNPGGQTGTFRWAYGRDRSHDANPTVRYPVYEFWLRDNAVYYDKSEEKKISSDWKVVVVSRGVILMEEDATDILPFNNHPYADFRFDDIGEFWGISLIDHMAHPQLYINRLLAALQMNAEMAGNPVFLEPSQSGIARTTIPARPGNRLTVNAAAMQANSGPRWLDPPQMPPVLDLINFWISRMENLSGMSPMAKGQNPPTQRTSQATSSQIQEAAFVRVRSAQRNLEKCLEEGARKQADLIIQNYNEPRLLNTLGPNASQSVKQLKANHFNVPGPKGVPEPLKYSLMIQAGASAPTSRQARIVEADKLYAMHALDRKSLLQAHQWPNMNEVLKRIADQQAMGIQPGAPTQRSATRGPAG